MTLPNTAAHQSHLPPPSPQARFADYKDFAVDLRKCLLLRAGKTEPLTQKQMSLLCYLADRPGILVSRTELNREVFGCSEEARSRTLDTHMAMLRRKLETHPNRPTLLVTVRGHGYVFRPAAQIAAAG